jgi:AcrR family transcriptional regulator
MPKPTAALVPRGRPRSLRAKRAILDAVRHLVEKGGGYSAATIEAIAERSGVAKTTIYRWWPNRAALAVDVLVEVAAEVAPPPNNNGDPMQALRTELHLVAQAAESLPGRLLMSLLGEAESDPDVHTALIERLFTPRREATAKVIRRAQAAGAIRGDVEPRLIGDLFFGPLFYRKFIRREVVTKAFVKRVFECVRAGVDPGGAPRK